MAGHTRIALSVAALVAGITLTGVPTEAGEGTGPPETVRVERFFPHGFGASYSYDSGTIGLLPLGPVRMPSSRRADVTVSLTFEYSVTPGDTGTVSVSRGREEYSNGRSLVPKRLRLASPGEDATSTVTLVFMKRGVPAGGRTLHFTASPNLELTGCCGSFGASRLVAVIDVRPAGDR